MTNAARSSGVKQQTVSKAIAILERDFGHQLLDRSHPGATPTEFGKGFYKHAKKVLADYAKLQEFVESYEE